MAQIKEILGSRTGGSRGMNAGDEPRVFRVLVEETDMITNPRSGQSYMRDPRGLLADPEQINSVPMGSPHPWDETAFARRYTIVEQKSPRHFRIRVDYVRINLPYLGPIGSWLVSIRGTSISHHLETAREFEFTGVSAGRRGIKKIPGPTPGGGWILSEEYTHIGMPKWIEVGSASEATHYTSRGETVYLKEEPDSLADRGTDMELPGVVMIYRRTIANYNPEAQAIDLMPYIKATNAHTFHLHPPGHVKCDDITVDPIDMEIVGQNVLGRAWAVTIVFVASALPVAPYSRVAYHPDDEGYESIVYTDEALTMPVIKTWYTMRAASFDSLLGLFEGR